ncbi:hypothetical protein GPECTOR_115g341 [Gonium pectorale]|uniref:Mce/MlaD domain-containing protein n=1 Tax=Gonium pectorale TaxID=33097 RepID=A0A150FZ39_GONPE|nr:hypothetical protein GPECTOR_115g341 [Gonium pectorale]|eukprot:KXZ42847.1 hypothetical protein GPECTOR_115g341 [Gonium pectorale]
MNPHAIGTPVRIRGVQVGQVLAVKPSLERVDVLVEVNDVSTVIPRNSVIEANQSGLIAEPLVDITPQLPVPAYSALPHEPGCAEEGLLVCANGSIAGRQGVALDDLVYIMTRTLEHVESLSSDVSLLARDSGVQRNLKTLVQALSRLLDD